MSVKLKMGSTIKEQGDILYLGKKYAVETYEIKGGDMVD